MRPVKHPVSRTGTRSVPRKGAANPAVRRNNLAHARKRQHSSDFALLRFIEDVKNRAFKIPPLLVVTVLLFIGLGAYGLFVGGHVAAAMQSVGHQGNRLLALAGFSVQEVTVKGRSHADAKALVGALGVAQGDPIFGLDTDGARERIEKLDWVKSATVTRLLPDTVHVEIVERVPFAIWQRGGELTIVDLDGYSITSRDVSAYGSLPLVVGFGAARQAPALLTLMQKEQPALLARVRAFVLVGERRWNLRLENGVDVKLPETGIGLALADVVALDQQYRIFSRDIQSIDLRLPDRVSIRLTKEGAAARGLAIGAKIDMGKKQSGTGQTNPVKAPASVGNET
jgi:cell division protein FtsQ